jgi:hypothetical protein
LASSSVSEFRFRGQLMPSMSSSATGSSASLAKLAKACSPAPSAVAGACVFGWVGRCGGARGGFRMHAHVGHINTWRLSKLAYHRVSLSFHNCSFTHACNHKHTHPDTNIFTRYRHKQRQVSSSRVMTSSDGVCKPSLPSYARLVIFSQSFTWRVGLRRNPSLSLPSPSAACFRWLPSMCTTPRTWQDSFLLTGGQMTPVGGMRIFNCRVLNTDSFQTHPHTHTPGAWRGRGRCVGFESRVSPSLPL